MGNNLQGVVLGKVDIDEYVSIYSKLDTISSEIVDMVFTYDIREAIVFKNLSDGDIECMKEMCSNLGLKVLEVRFVPEIV